MKRVGRILASGMILFFVIAAWPNFALSEDENKTSLDHFKINLAPINEATAPQPKGRTQKSHFNFPRKALFLNANLGIFIFQEATASIETAFSAYGEEGSIAQKIRLSSPLGLEINVGKYIALGKLKIKAGLGLDSFPLKATGSFQLSMPHPYLYSSFRNYYFSEEFKNTSLHFYGFAYFVPLETWRLQLSLGPIVAFSTGKYPGLEDLEIEDKSPFRWSDLEIKKKAYRSDSFRSPSFGGGLNIAFFLVENMAFQMSYKYHFLKPEIDVLKQKVNLSFSRLIFCVEFCF